MIVLELAGILLTLTGGLVLILWTLFHTTRERKPAKVKPNREPWWKRGRKRRPWGKRD